MMMAGVKKQNLKIKKNNVKVTLAREVVDNNILNRAMQTAIRIGATTDLPLMVILRSIPELKDLRKHFGPSNMTLDRRLMTTVDYTPDGMMLQQSIDVLTQARERLAMLVRGAIENECDSVGDVISKIDKELGRREGRDDMEEL